MAPNRDEDFLARLKDVAGRNLSDFARRLELPQRTVHNYLTGRSRPSAEFIRRIQDRMGIRAAWLIHGVLPKHVHARKDPVSRDRQRKTGQRIRDVRTRSGMSVPAFAKKMGVPEHFIAEFEEGGMLPPGDFLARLCIEFGLRPEWLVGGVGTRDAGPEASPSAGRVVSVGRLMGYVSGLNRSLQGHLAFYCERLRDESEISEDYWDAVWWEFIDKARAQHLPMAVAGDASGSTESNGQPSVVGHPSDFAFIQRCDCDESLESRPGREPQGPSEYLAFRRDWLKMKLDVPPEALAVITAKGDGMSPTISSGDLVIVDVRVREFGGEGIYWIDLDGSRTVKRIQKWPDGRLTVRADNAAYQPMTLGVSDLGRVRFLGRVVWVGHQLYP